MQGLKVRPEDNLLLVSHGRLFFSVILPRLDHDLAQDLDHCCFCVNEDIQRVVDGAFL